MNGLENILSRFHPLIEGWFAEKVGQPTEVQEKGWSRIAEGEHVLITTPESLNLLLSSVGGRTILKGLSTVILDEIHGVVGNKRGVHLITAVDRLVPLVGELDEEFVWEASIGQSFTLGTQNWKIKRITHNDVFVIPGHPKSMATPFWKGEARNRDFHFSMKIESLLRKRLEGSGFFGARFRECAGRSLLLTRSRFNQRLPLWMNRLRSQKLLDAVLQYEDFPILLETWRTCLQDEFDLEGLKEILNELESGVMEWSETRTRFPSPMAQSVTWRQVSEYMYKGDEALSGKRSRLRTSLLRDVAHTLGLRPTISPEIVVQFELKRKRLSPGYSPATSQDLLDWVKERLIIPLPEWESLMEAIGRDHEGDPDEILISLIGEWLQFYGPISVDDLGATLGIEDQRLLPALETLLDSETLVAGRLVKEGKEDDVCDGENFEILLRLARADAVPAFEPLGLEWLPLFLATYQGVADPESNVEGLFHRLEQLLCYNIQAGVWESEIFPARLRPYDPSWLDAIMQEGDLRWIGSKNNRSGFSRWKGSLPLAGNWFRLSGLERSDDLLEMEERKKDRVRLLLDRYGILFRELLIREIRPFQWSTLFRSLRLMELSGEILAGYFFHGVPGPQFISHRAFRLLQRKIREDVVFWVNALDPASTCGVPLEALKGTLPKRIGSTHVVYRGKKLALVSIGHGKALTFHVPPDDPQLQSVLAPLRHLLTRRFKPLRRITIEKINGEEAVRSPYLDALRTSFEVLVDYRKVTLYSSAKR